MTELENSTHFEGSRKGSTRSGISEASRAELKNGSLRAPLGAAKVLPRASIARAGDVVPRAWNVVAAGAEGEGLEIGIASVHLERLERAKLLGRLHVAKNRHRSPEERRDCLYLMGYLLCGCCRAEIERNYLPVTILCIVLYCVQSMLNSLVESLLPLNLLRAQQMSPLSSLFCALIMQR